VKDLRMDVFLECFRWQIGQFVEERQGSSSGFGIVGNSCDEENSVSVGAICFLNDVF
jgi:hypothetical protein